MAIELICKGCARKLRVADENAGKVARCPSCGETFTVPLGAGAVSPQAPEPASALGSGVFAPTQPFAGAPAGSQSPVDLWYLKTENGVTYGPASKADLDSWVAEGRVTAASQIRREGTAEWQLARNIYPTLVMGASANPYSQAGSSPGQNPFGDSHPGAQPNPYQAPVFGPGQEVYGRTGMINGRLVQPHRGGVILTMGILGICLCQILGVIAVVMASQDLKQMSEGRMDASGKGLTMAGLVMGIISIVIFAASVLAGMAGGFR